VKWLILAAERASEQHYMKSAVRLATRGLDLLGEEVDDEHVPSMLRLCLIRAASHAEQRNIARARADLDRVLHSSALRGDLESEAEAHEEEKPAEAKEDDEKPAADDDSSSSESSSDDFPTKRKKVICAIIAERGLKGRSAWN
jgi:hypothetical protein